MGIINRKEIFKVEDSTLTFEKLIGDASQEIALSLQDKSVVILPSHGHDDAYYAGTLDTFDYLSENGIDTGIYSTDDEYKELGLHGADIWLGTFFVKDYVIPIFCSIVAAYVYDKIKAKKGDNISLEFIAEKKDGKAVSVQYDGDVEGLGKVLDTIKSINDGD
ncbi:MAG: hypothetical protein WC782_07275 [Methylococcaceae bacterium]|jgi:hypothetical protein